ncbi:MAG: hypothetical protein IJ193_04455 [Bacilli bacterium]|nr:hypothetical protein [Bacilli bacterium]
MNKLKLITHYVELFFISFIFFLFTGLCLARITVFHRSFMISCIPESHYKEVEDSLKKEMKHSMISSGIRSEVIDTMFTSNDIKKSTERAFDIVYSDYRLKFDHSDIEKRLRDNIQKDLEEQHFTSNDQKGLDEFVKSVMKIYEGEFQMLNHISKLGKLIQFGKPFVDAGCYLLGGIILLWMIFRRKYLSQILSVPLFTTGMLILFGIYYVSNRTGIRSFTMFSLTFSKSIRMMVLRVFKIYNYTAICYFLIGILILLFRRYKKKKIRNVVLTQYEQEEINSIEVPSLIQKREELPDIVFDGLIEELEKRSNINTTKKKKTKKTTKKKSSK